MPVSVGIEFSAVDGSYVMKYLFSVKMDFRKDYRDGLKEGLKLNMCRKSAVPVEIFPLLPDRMGTFRIHGLMPQTGDKEKLKRSLNRQ